MIRLLPLALAGLLGACASSPSPVAPPAELTEFTPSLQAQPLWARGIGRGTDNRYLKLPPVLDGEQLFASDRLGTVMSVASGDGRVLWTQSLDAGISGAPADGDDLLLLGGSAEVIALDKQSGAVRWRAPVSSEVLAAPVRSGNMVVARAVDGSLHGLSALDGRRVWRVQRQVPLLSLRGTSPPVVVGEGVLAGFANGRLGVFGLQDGRVIWEVPVAVPRGRTELERLVDVDAELQVADGVVYAASFQGRVAAFALGTGRLLWSREISSHAGVAIDGTTLYVSDEHGDVWALAKGNGGTLWKQPSLHGRGLSAPVVHGDALVVGDFDGYLHWLARDDGRFLARARVEPDEVSFPLRESEPLLEYRENRAVVAAPIVHDDMLYTIDQRGLLAAFRVVPTK